MNQSTETRQQVRREGRELEKRMRARAKAEAREERKAKLPRKTDGSEEYWAKRKNGQARLGRVKG